MDSIGLLGMLRTKLFLMYHFLYQTVPNLGFKMRISFPDRGFILELSDPVQFEPVGQVTAVFYDVKNQQVSKTAYINLYLADEI